MRFQPWVYLSMVGSCLAQGDIVSLLKSQEDLSTLLELVGLVDGLAGRLATASNVTIVAPTNKAFADVPRNIPEGQAIEFKNDTIAIGALLANHVFKGVYPSNAITEVPIFAQTLLDSSYVNAVQPFSSITGGQYNGIVKNAKSVCILSGEQTISTVTKADIRLGDGIIVHKIDTVLSFGAPFQLFTYRAGYTAMNAALEAAKLNINFGLSGSDVQTLNASDYTLLVPTNAAFTSIGSVLQNVDMKTLQQVLSYHIIPNNVIFSPSLGNVTVKTLQGSDLVFTVLPDGSAWVNNAKIVFPNTLLFEGVAHVIDSVLNPLPFDRASLKPNTPASERIAFPSASVVSALPFASASLAFAGDLETYTTTPELLRTVAALATPTNNNASATADATATRPPIATFTGTGYRLTPNLVLFAVFIMGLFAAY